MPPDPEPASALAARIVGDLFDSTGERADVWRVEQLIESDRAFVREPLERRNRELETLVCDEREVILQQRERIASLEAQLASAREDLEALIDACDAAADCYTATELLEAANAARSKLPPPAAQKEPSRG